MIISERIGFIGAGKMAEALIRSILKKGLSSAEKISASDKVIERLDYLKKETDIKVFHNNIDTVKNSDILFLSVKPQDFNALLPEVKDYVDSDKLIISIAAGIKISFINNIIPNAKVIRVMPNILCLIGEMAGAYCIGDNVTEKDISIAHSLLSSAGKVFLVKEEQLDAVTGLSGSGPAFVSYLIMSFIQAGKELGIEEDICRELTLQTFLGSAKLLQENNLSEESLIKMVKSPGGTTEAGMNILENSELKNIIIKTITRATERSKELGKK